MSDDRILSTLSLAQRAGQIASGGFSTEKAVKEGRAQLVIVAEDASENTKKKMRNMTTFYGVPLYYYSVKEDLARSIGKDYRSMLAVTDQGFADSLKRQFKTESQSNREEKEWQK